MLMQSLYLLLVVSIMAGLYVNIAVIASRLKRQVQTGLSVLAHDEESYRKQALKTVRVFLLVFGSLLICLPPFFGTYTYLAMNGLSYYEPGFYWPTWVADVLWLFNSWINPVIYCWKYKDFKVALKKLLSGKH